jgi:hypothetical protein
MLSALCCGYVLQCLTVGLLVSCFVHARVYKG